MNAMKNALLFLALVNLLAIGGLVAWLFGSGRLNADRARQIRVMLSTTIAEQATKDAEAEAKRKADEAAAAEKARRAGTPMAADEKIDEARDERDLLDQQRARAREEARQLQTLLEGKRAELEAVNREVTEAQRVLADAKQEFQNTVGDEQFAAAVDALQAQRPAMAASVLKTMLEAPAPAQAELTTHARAQRSLVVKYLSAMDDAKRIGVIGEFAKTDPRLAGELLEAIRLRGTPTAQAGGVGP
ncbi:MAG: hypothetical protein MUE97_04710 [Phycisphaerales bacterium]|jgi:chromosome segregation ATPase|nr:hypothetical protein [Phycisphaerales bacterium]